MSSVPGVDHPAEQSEVDIRLTSANVSVTARVEVVHDGVISVRPSTSEYVGQSVAGVGDLVEVYWMTGDGHRAVPAEVTDVEQGAVIRWRLTISGEAEHSQRREAVRGRLALPVEAEFGGVPLTGETVDISENGTRAHFEGFGLPPEPGTTFAMVIAFEDGGLRARGEVIRIQIRGSRWSMSIRFAEIEEKAQDRIRRRVFQALREERARLAE
ncbi:PilZ domain-containing protein [Blastococcus saxobsidens]|uniref:PilZ domain-containing protein n=1 Tax=Blastococcus saxobsidens TaxID=138336 RepID=A0A6L9VYG2_9ACTN|nr:PilZ domain-containing protein [Blastococcus saxobsidens]NEK84833.1 PilZ domain-containing protein [Blastococcus saxobsidens]